MPSFAANANAVSAAPGRCPARPRFRPASSPEPARRNGLRRPSRMLHLARRLGDRDGGGVRGDHVARADQLVEFPDQRTFSSRISGIASITMSARATSSIRGEDGPGERLVALGLVDLAAFDRGGQRLLRSRPGGTRTAADRGRQRACPRPRTPRRCPLHEPTASTPTEFISRGMAAHLRRISRISDVSGRLRTYRWLPVDPLSGGNRVSCADRRHDVRGPVHRRRTSRSADAVDAAAGAPRCARPAGQSATSYQAPSTWHRSGSACEVPSHEPRDAPGSADTREGDGDQVVRSHAVRGGLSRQPSTVCPRAEQAR